MEDKKPRVCIDFDGVLHSYISVSEGLDIVLDPPVKGAITWLRKLIQSNKFRIAIYSVRNNCREGVCAMQSWLLANKLSAKLIGRIEFPECKPAAVMYIDDRGFMFQGEFPTIEEIVEFTPWNRG